MQPAERRTATDYPPGDYLIRRHDAWFRPGAHGYTVHFGAAGVYSRDQAVRYLDVEGLTIHPLSEVREQMVADLNRAREEWEGISRLLARFGPIEAGVRVIARPIEEWNEGIGDVLWWKFPIEEAPWIGSPLTTGYTTEVWTRDTPAMRRMVMRGQVGGWPGYHTHWTPITVCPVLGEDRG